MDPTGLLSKIADGATGIDFGRKGFATRGKEHEGRILYEDGISNAMSAFQEAKTAASSIPQPASTVMGTVSVSLYMGIFYCAILETPSLCGKLNKKPALKDDFSLFF